MNKLDIELVENALKKGIKIKKNNVFINVPGYLMLMYMKEIEQFVLIYGYTKENSGYVFLHDYQKEWILN